MDAPIVARFHALGKFLSSLGWGAALGGGSLVMRRGTAVRNAPVDRVALNFLVARDYSCPRHFDFGCSGTNPEQDSKSGPLCPTVSEGSADSTLRLAIWDIQ